MVLNDCVGLFVGCDRLRFGRYQDPILVGERTKITKSPLQAEYVCPSLQLCHILRLATSPCLLITVCWQHPMIEYHIPYLVEPTRPQVAQAVFPSCKFYPQVRDHRSSLVDGSPVDGSISSGLRALGSLATLSTQRVQLGRAWCSVGRQSKVWNPQKYHRNPYSKGIKLESASEETVAFKYLLIFTNPQVLHALPHQAKIFHVCGRQLLRLMTSPQPMVQRQAGCPKMSQWSKQQRKMLKGKYIMINLGVAISGQSIHTKVEIYSSPNRPPTALDCLCFFVFTSGQETLEQSLLRGVKMIGISCHKRGPGRRWVGDCWIFMEFLVTLPYFGDALLTLSLDMLGTN